MIKPCAIKGAFSFILIILLLSIVVPGVNAAGKSAISSIEISVDLDESGNGRVEEIWDMEIFDGTENYKQFFGLKFGESISDFSVRENSIDYEFLENWDANKSRKEKANKCGINYTGEGQELCWGIGEENGRHVYTIQYTINKLAALETDRDGEKKAALYWQFVTKTFQYAETVYISVRMPQRISDAYRFWIFGFNGDITIEGNTYKITAKEVKEGHFVELALVMPSEDFPGASEADSSKLTAIYKNGKSGNELDRYTSKAPNDNIWSFIIISLIGLFFTAFWVIFAVVIVVILKSMARMNKIIKHAPSGKMPEESFEGMSYLLSALNYKPDLLNTFMIKWISKKYLEMGTITRKIRNFEIDEKKIILNAAPETFEGDVERMLFELIVKAFEKAGTDTLSVEDFRKYVSTNNQKIEIIEHHKKISMDCCYERGWVNNPQAKRGNKKILTAEGQKLFHEMLGFGSFLYNRVFLEQKEEEYVPSLDNFLIFAELMGISGKFRTEFKKSAPLLYDSDFRFRYMRSRFYYTPSSSSGSSGSGSSGGGGGGSSGGGGGGTR